MEESTNEEKNFTFCFNYNVRCNAVYKLYVTIVGILAFKVVAVKPVHPRAVLSYTKNVINCDIHTRVRTKKILRAAGAERVFGLDDPENIIRVLNGEEIGTLVSNE